jgi:GDP-L-fucose synthase
LIGLDKMIDLKTKNITVTGGRGFLGNHLVKKLKDDRECRNVNIADLPEFDLRNLKDINRMYEEQKPDIVIHLAAVVGGIGANRNNPGRFFYDNAIMGIQLMHEAYLHRIEKFVAIGTICCYPKHTPVPFSEDNLWDGYPEETNAPYGLAKKMMLVQSQAYRQQYNFNSIFLMPVNLYGPGDNFDPDSSHVIPALIRKCYEAKTRGDENIVVWGDGSPTREFLFVDDAAEGIILASGRYDKSEPVNLGSSIEISIKGLVDVISRLVGFHGKILWDTSKPNGQPRRKLDINRAKREFGFCASMPFEEGLKQTIAWYIKKLHQDKDVS